MNNLLLNQWLVPFGQRENGNQVEYIDEKRPTTTTITKELNIAAGLKNGQNDPMMMMRVHYNSSILAAGGHTDE